MKKTLYSLMLSDEVVREIDILAHRMGTSRSNLINQILAEHVSLRTPEQQMNDIFEALIQRISPSRDLVPFREQGAATMSMKSCLEYKYRPTVRYEVELSRSLGGGTLAVIFRTQSAALIDAMTEFFTLWKRIEDTYLTARRDYSLVEGRFVRTLEFPPEADTDALAAAISDYVQTFDALMKRYIGGTMRADDVAAAYRQKFAGCYVI
jgi:hypothetical protein